jgi:hypothetical protein
MSYTVNPYLIDIEELRRIYGSHDEDLVRQIEENFVEDIHFYNEEAIDIFGETTVTINQALRELVDGRCRQNDVWQYGCALEFVCRHIGKPLPNNQFDNLHGRGLLILSFIKIIDELVFKSKSPVPIPLLEKNGIQHVGHITYEAAHKQFSQKKPLFLPDEDDIWKLNLQEQFYSWIEIAVQMKRGIITFL